MAGKEGQVRTHWWRVEERKNFAGLGKVALTGWWIVGIGWTHLNNWTLAVLNLMSRDLLCNIFVLLRERLVSPSNSVPRSNASLIYTARVDSLELAPV